MGIELDHASNGNVEEVEQQKSASRKSKCPDGNSLLIYLSHFLSSFGDRVWQFAVGLYLYYLYPCSLLLTAVYGLTTCGSLFIFGASVGRWVDNSKRLHAARVTILIQNSMVVLNAMVMASAIYYKTEIANFRHRELLEVAIYSVIIIMEVVAELASMANKLVLEKDWIVVMAQGDEQKLSTLNAIMRTINLSCQILAPFAVGHLLEWCASYVTGAIVIASWNAISAIVEYYLLHVIFSLVPELGEKKAHAIEEIENENALESRPRECDKISACLPTMSDERNNNKNAYVTPRLGRSIDCNGDVEENETTTTSGPHHSRNNSQLCKFCAAWGAYFSHPVRFAGLGLASLYMTVLCFDNVTIGYLSSQGVSPALSGNLTAVSALIGILGSLSFPYLRRKLGKNKAGMVGFAMETLSLLLCVGSICAPGSPFKADSIMRLWEQNKNENQASSECEIQDIPEVSLKEQWEKYSNIFLLMAGMVFARYGLWVADLSVTQIFQEKVSEGERGVMGGVQDSLNQLMSLVKFLLTIVLPYPEAFGYLICASWFFVFLGGLLFLGYTYEDKKKKMAVAAY